MVSKRNMLNNSMLILHQATANILWHPTFVEDELIVDKLKWKK